MQAVWPRAAVLKAGLTFSLEAFDPFTDSPRADPEGCGYGLWDLLLDQYAAYQFRSTMGGKTGILMDVHSVLRESLKSRNLSFLGRGRMDNLLKAHS